MEFGTLIQGGLHSLKHFLDGERYRLGLVFHKLYGQHQASMIARSSTVMIQWADGEGLDTAMVVLAKAAAIKVERAHCRSVE